MNVEKKSRGQRGTQKKLKYSVYIISNDNKIRIGEYRTLQEISDVLKVSRLKLARFYNGLCKYNHHKKSIGILKDIEIIKL